MKNSIQLSNHQRFSPRRCHLVDVENLAFGEQRADDADRAIAEALRHYRHRTRTDTGDAAVVGCAPGFGFAAHRAWPTAALRTRAGRDGGELAVIATADPFRLANRFVETWIGSGDGAFVPLAKRLRSLGATVVVVSWSDKLARGLRQEASRVVLLDPDVDLDPTDPGLDLRSPGEFELAA